VEVGLAVLPARPLDPALDPDLTLQLAPPEDQGRPRIGGQFGALAALVVGVEAEAALVEPAQQDHPGRRPAVRGRGGQGHGGRFKQAGPLGLLEPAPELDHRIGVDLALAKRSLCVLLPHTPNATPW
jgi:hypothetical protein